MRDELQSFLPCCVRPPTCAGGNSLTIKVARSSQSEQQCLENALAAITAAVEKVPRKWDGVQVRSRAGQGNTAGGKRTWGLSVSLLISHPALMSPTFFRLRILQALFLKTADSVALPVWQVLPEAPAKIA